jgi:uncharacterized C2H2 Zn-finger protein
MNFKYKIAEFFSGRYIYYGIDLLTKLLAAICILLSVINLFIGSYLIYLLETSLLIWMFFRLFSKNIYKRQQENSKATAMINGIKNRIAIGKRMHSDRETHIYKKCPHCSVMLRLPKKPGEHTVNCPRCKNNFKVKVR